MLPEDVFKQALTVLDSQRVNFQRKYAELKALAESIKDAQDHGKATHQDYKTLEVELKELWERRHKYESGVEVFKTNLGDMYPDASSQADNDFDESLQAYITIKLQVDRLMRKIQNQQKSLVDVAFTKEDKAPIENPDFEDSFSDNIDSHWDTENEASVVKEKDEEVDTKAKSLGYLKSLCIGAVIVIVFFSGLGVFINAVLKGRQGINSWSTKGFKSIAMDNSTCLESFMLRDSVCDEATNTELCLYDGGDCCLDAKDTTLCRNCSCILTVDPDVVESQFAALDIKPHKNSVSIDNRIVQVEDVISAPVCAVLCLDHDLAENINSWIYRKIEKICECGWIQSVQCPENTVLDAWNWYNVSDLAEHLSFVQLNKTVPCDCLAIDFVIESEGTTENDKEKSAPTMSAYHCKWKCISDFDCAWFSWQISDGTCMRMKELPENSTMVTSAIVQTGWVSSPKTCQNFSTNFYRNEYGFMCPKNGMDDEIENEEYLIIANGLTLTSNDIAVFKVDDDDMRECAHSMKSVSLLQESTGSIMLKDGNFLIVACGGPVLDSLEESKKCRVLNDQDVKQSGSMKSSRSGAASLVMDHGQTVWITGGFSENEDPIDTTEFVVMSNQNFQSLDYGPALPIPLKYHCLAEVGPGSAVLIGGVNQHGHYSPLTYSIRLDTLVWREESRLLLGRAQHVCGVLEDSSKSGSKIIVAVGGDISDMSMTATVEILMVHNDTLISDWQDGPLHPTLMSNAASTVTADKSKLIVVGGIRHNDYSQASTDIFLLECISIPQCHWWKMHQELQKDSAKGFGLLLPSTPMESKWTSLKPCEDENNLLLSAGWNGFEEQSDTVTMSISANVTLTWCKNSNTMHSPLSLKMATGGVVAVNSTQTMNVSIICGGSMSSTLNADCYKLGNPEPVCRMISYREGAASIVIKNGTTLWVTGGFNGIHDLDTTELIEANSASTNSTLMTATPFLYMPHSVSHHCFNLINQDLGILTGGKNGKDVLDATLIIHVNATTKIVLDDRLSMNVGRKNHICGVLKATLVSDHSRKYVIAAGGTLRDGSVTSTMEILQVDEHVISDDWRQGEPLPVGLSMAGSATTHDQSKLFVSGGMILDQPMYEASKNIYSLTCFYTDCQWEKINLELPYPRTSSVAMIIPLNMDTMSDNVKQDSCHLFDSTKGGYVLQLK